MGQPVVHFEIGCRDRAKTEQFFADLFGWHIQQNGPASMIDTASEEFRDTLPCSAMNRSTTPSSMWKWMMFKLTWIRPRPWEERRWFHPSKLRLAHSLGFPISMAI
jgi:hypothetical protein